MDKIEDRKISNAEDYEDFLFSDIAGTLADGLVAKNIAGHIFLFYKKWKFHKNCTKFVRKEDKYRAAFQKAKKKAEADIRLQDYNNNIPPEKDMKWYYCDGDCCGDYEVVSKDFWSKPLPFSPEGWIMSHYGTEIDNLFYYDRKEANTKEKLMCDRVVLGLIHDEAKKVAKCDRLCNIENEKWRGKVWDHLKLCDGEVWQYGEIIQDRLIEAWNALGYVRDDDKRQSQKTKSTEAVLATPQVNKNMSKQLKDIQASLSRIETVRLEQIPGKSQDEEVNDSTTDPNKNRVQWNIKDDNFYPNKEAIKEANKAGKVNDIYELKRLDFDKLKKFLRQPDCTIRFMSQQSPPRGREHKKDWKKYIKKQIEQAQAIENAIEKGVINRTKHL